MKDGISEKLILLNLIEDMVDIPIILQKKLEKNTWKTNIENLKK